jgi:hypothetical protein
LEVLPAPASGPHPASRARIQPSNLDQPAGTRAFKPKARNGKIARLSYPERDMVNRMLRNNISHDKIRGALNEHGTHVTERNISNWKTRGGYQDWCAEEDRAVEGRIRQDNLLEHVRHVGASQLPEVGLQAAATSLSQFFLKAETQQQLLADPEKCARSVGILCRLARQISALQKYRDDSAKELGSKHNPHRINNEIEKHIEITRNVWSSFIPDNAPIDPEIPHRNYLPKNYYTPMEPLD